MEKVFVWKKVIQDEDCLKSSETPAVNSEDLFIPQSLYVSGTVRLTAHL